ncbi:winged helix-turn-helix domain-containing protein [Pseudaestuariivita rosea]|uniref:winged helix-turn-helix domain-containing protein n=1 Tax=Pseudaestuariivita rosea TaxID=2763263 RepID=UPI001ABB5D16|nr:LysR family transcriptional regulator [Pseudaestuariivita rosea]
MTDPDKEFRVRVVFDNAGMIGPGKADLLQKIDETGSISAAGRQMGMSYKRAWMLVDTMNTIFKAPVVSSSRGGAQGGGAALTDMGQKVLKHYRDMHGAAWQAAQPDMDALKALLKETQKA